MAEKKSFLLRMNPKLYEVMEKWAADEFRSVNAHIEFLLREAAVKNGRWGSRNQTAEVESFPNNEEE